MEKREKVKEIYKLSNVESKIGKRNIVVSNYDQLIKELKSHNISPQEAFNLAYKNKYQFNARYHWTMARIGMYLKTRYIEYLTLSLKLRRKKFKYKRPAEISQKQKKIITQQVLKIRSKKIDSCRKTVNSENFVIQFKKFNPKAKFDARKEVQNLHKLVTEKRHRDKFYNGKWDVISSHSLVKRGYERSLKLNKHHIENLR
tara:strand:- start:165 stop:767 length:603 start_codon:yes stop_codon:yes gene_type:complete